MGIDKPAIRERLEKFDFTGVFTQELGWDFPAANVTVSVAGQVYSLLSVAQKRGVQVFQCQPGADGRIPDHATRRKIEKQVTKSAYEHLIIFVDEARTTQIWQWVARQPGQPALYREHPYYPGHQSGDALIQKLSQIYIPLDEEEALDLTGATHRLRDAFDRDLVTKKFYDRFKAEHTAFLAFIKGITDQADKEWYASLMLNRMMFIYFIQRKGFLDGEVNYLRDRLRKVQLQRGRGKFLTFYRYFLLVLFHEGFDKEPRERVLDADLTALLGAVPYLNGGLFDVHELEGQNAKLDIPDEAFERLFAFFDEWDWHLDSRPLRNDREINPDVLGYIFEKYINQKQMGAYYTKEDITEYIGKSTIIPFLFDAAKKEHPAAFVPGSPLWRLLRDDPDRYIYPSVRHGVVGPDGEVIPLPTTIAEGIAEVSKRGTWNRAAPDAYGLPTETWREHVARRQRCLEIRDKLRRGEAQEINDLITLNLNLRQFAEDDISGSEGPDLLRAFWHAIRDVTVLDPTCGSGAFLFAALNILQPLYEACLERMQAFVDDLDRSGERHSPKKFDDFRAVLADIERHPSRDYCVLKSIIVRNLYGVDIMEEAVEICKLRLFLKLVAQVESVDQLEPLPDVDFNVRPGNTLVGFARLDDVKRSLERKHSATETIKAMPGFEESDQVTCIIEEAEIVDRAFRKFHEMQTQQGMDGRSFSAAKQELRQRLDMLAEQLDRYLAGEYGIDADKKKKEFAEWRASHEPFHWFAEFYGIMNGGGFDVIIGNPPWKEYAEVKKEYTVRGYASEPCGNLHCVCTERGLGIRQPKGRMSFIVQLPLVSSSRMGPIRRLLSRASSTLYVIPFDDRPGKLFDGLQHCRSVIFLSQGAIPDVPSSLLTTRYQRWATEVREHLFARIEYAHVSGELIATGAIPKYGSDLQEHLFRLVKQKGSHTIAGSLSRRETSNFIFYQEATQYWVKATHGLPYYAKNDTVSAPAHGRYLFFAKPETAHVACAVLNSSLFYAYFIAYGDCFHLSDGLASGFPVSDAVLSDAKLVELNKKLMKDLRSQAVRKTIKTKGGDTISYDEFYCSSSKPIIDEIDCLLAEHYGFTPEELDMVINFDIKYRMGQNGGDNE
ncbi:MAG: DNA methyltransferase [Isosphaeraceae bacterium]